MKDYIPRGVDEFSVWLGVLAREVAVHGAALGIEPAEIAALEADAARFCGGTGRRGGGRKMRTGRRCRCATRTARRQSRRVCAILWAACSATRRCGITSGEGMGITVPDKTPTRLSDRFIRETGPAAAQCLRGRGEAGDAAFRPQSGKPAQQRAALRHARGAAVVLRGRHAAARREGLDFPRPTATVRRTCMSCGIPRW